MSLTRDGRTSMYFYGAKLASVTDKFTLQIQSAPKARADTDNYYSSQV